MAFPFAKYPPFPLFNVEINHNYHGIEVLLRIRPRVWKEGNKR